MITLPDPLKPLAAYLIEHGTFPIVVGGYIRDTLLDRTSKDIDIEIYNVRDFETLRGLLEPFGQVCSVGKSFGVLKMEIDGYDLDISLPRTESKTGPGHRGFDVRLNPQLDFTTAARRRDFTINAIGFDIHSSYLLDPYGGREDLRNGVLRCVDPATFVEDPLRVLRAVQMAARYNLRCNDALTLLCRKMVKEGYLDELPKERVFGEMRKLLLKAECPSEGLRLMERIDVLELFPELARLYANNSLWKQTLRAVDAMASMRSGDPAEELILMFAALCHNLEKTSENPAAGATAARTFLERITNEKDLIRRVELLVEHHLKPLLFYRRGAGASEIRKLSLTVPLEQLVKLARAHHAGTADDARTEDFPAGTWLLQKAEAYGAKPELLRPLLQGRDLIAAGLPPSEAFATILEAAFEAQLEGTFDNHEGALEWLSRRISDNQNEAAVPASENPTSAQPL
jgi:tRNA nucleotidyltransferase (CCA-adding enzyme)